MPLQRNLFAYTARGPEAFPDFVSVNAVDGEDFVTISCRGNQGRNHADVKIPREDWERLKRS